MISTNVMSLQRFIFFVSLIIFERYLFLAASSICGKYSCLTEISPIKSGGAIGNNPPIDPVLHTREAKLSSRISTGARILALVELAVVVFSLWEENECSIG
jgi:hypothetical protein